MTILTHPKSFQELLTYENGTDYAYELIEGELNISDGALNVSSSHFSIRRSFGG